jgi:hypothetical protein
VTSRTINEVVMAMGTKLPVRWMLAAALVLGSSVLAQAAPQGAAPAGREKNLTCLRVDDPAARPQWRRQKNDTCPTGSVLVALDDNPASVAPAAPAPAQGGFFAALMRGGFGGPETASGSSQFCVSLAPGRNGALSILSASGGGKPCPTGYTLGSTVPVGGTASGALASSQAGGPDLRFQPGDLCLPTRKGMGPGFRLLGERCPTGFLRVAADNPASVGLSFASVSRGGEITCRRITTPQKAATLGLSNGLCEAGSVPVENDNPLSTARPAGPVATTGGRAATGPAAGGGALALASLDFCLPVRAGLGSGFPLTGGACPTGFVRVSPDNPTATGGAGAGAGGSSGGGRGSVSCLPVTDRRLARLRGLQTGLNGCGADEVAVADDNPTAVGDGSGGPGDRGSEGGSANFPGGGAPSSPPSGTAPDPGGSNPSGPNPSGPGGSNPSGPGGGSPSGPGGGNPSGPGGGNPSGPGGGSPSGPGGGSPSGPGGGNPSGPGGGNPSGPGGGNPSGPGGGNPSGPGGGHGGGGHGDGGHGGGGGHGDGGHGGGGGHGDGGHGSGGGHGGGGKGDGGKGKDC